MIMTSHLLPVFARVDLGFTHGEGCWLISTNGERYLDFTSGVAVNALGHAHPHLVKALQEQATRLWHMSNLFKSPDGERLAARLCEHSFADFVFFCNSGAEAMEGVIKLVRHYHFSKGHPERYRIVTFEGAFHGRTLATLAATGTAKYLEGFGPPVDGFDQVPHGDLEAVKKAIGPHTAGILIELVQGEGGVRSAAPSFIKALRALCDEHGLLLAFDEVQTGMGRTGDLFAYQHVGVEPDVMSLAKALGGGFPIGAVLASAEAASGMAPGSHGSTFGGNPLGGCGRQRRARRDARARLLRSCTEDVAAVETEARFRGRSLSDGAFRSARRGASDRRQGGGAVRRSRHRVARTKAAHGRRRRQRRALPGAIDRLGSRDRAIRAVAGTRLHGACGSPKKAAAQ